MAITLDGTLGITTPSETNTGTLSVTGVTTLTGGLNAALPVLSGGTGVTTKTGTGAVVLGTSPTLTTPILGTPTSGVLDNCTGTNLVKAWINYNGVAQTVTSSYNISSVTYNSAGSYKLNFTNAFSDIKYAIVATASNAPSTACSIVTINSDLGYPIAPTTTVCYIFTQSRSTGSGIDAAYISVSCVR
jgi:hypothetical protein